MPAAGDLAGPVSYSWLWGLVAVLGPLLVAGWYAGVTWFTRDRTVSHTPSWLRLRTARREHLRRLDRIEAAAADRTLSSREAHQAVSATVRSFVAEAGAVDARTMNLQQLRESELQPVAAVVEHVYPPAFAPDPVVEERAERASRNHPTDDRLTVALRDARELVSEWRS